MARANLVRDGRSALPGPEGRRSRRPGSGASCTGTTRSRRRRPGTPLTAPAAPLGAAGGLPDAQGEDLADQGLALLGRRLGRVRQACTVVERPARPSEGRAVLGPRRHLRLPCRKHRSAGIVPSSACKSRGCGSRADPGECGACTPWAMSRRPAMNERRAPRGDAARGRCERHGQSRWGVQASHKSRDCFPPRDSTPGRPTNGG